MSYQDYRQYDTAPSARQRRTESSSLWFGWVLAALLSLPVHADPLLQRGNVAVERGESEDFEAESVPIKSYALLIGNSNYETWPKLPGVTGDIQALRDALTKDRSGFDDIVVLEDLDRAELVLAISDFVDRYGYEDDAETLTRLFIYYAGHGHTFGDDQNADGYIVPVDAPLGDLGSAFKRSAMSFERFRALLSDIDADHVLVLFDSCFGGKVLQGRGAISKANIGLRRMLGTPSRRYITAGGPGETVPDQSTFARVLVDALNHGSADLSKDGYTSGDELAAHLRLVVTNESGDTQPLTGKGKLSRGYHGEFVFFQGQEQLAPTVVAPSTKPRSHGASRQLVLDYIDAMNSRTVDSFMGLLSERVNYHTWGSASKDRIRVDREAFKTRWPRATYALNSAPEIIELSETTVIANFAVTYDAWNFRKCTGSRGTSRFTLRINEIGGRWRIAGIQEQTPDRSSYDPCNRPGDDRG